MSKSTPTPGPWGISDDSIWATSPWNARVRIARVISFAPINGIDSHANARLIAAAPALLAACKLALGAFENNNAIDWSVLSDAIALAAPAEGDATHG